MTNTYKNNRKENWKYASVIILCVLVFVFYGCGKEIEKNPTGSGASTEIECSLVSLKGKVVPPLSGELTSSRAAYKLNSVQGTLVFLEDNPNLFAYANSNGDFVIKNVPYGKHVLIAEKNEGFIVFKQRQTNVEVSGKEEILNLEFPIPLEEAPYGLTVFLSDINNNEPINGTISLWGRIFNTFDGGINITPFPAGTSKKEATIKAIGYLDQTINLDFGESKRSQMYVKLTPTSGNPNRAPVVAIEQSELTVYTNSQLRLTATGYDPEGEKPVWNWTSNNGSLTTSNTDTVIFNTPAKAGHSIITLTGTDSRGATGMAVLNLDIIQRGSEPSKENNPPNAPNNPTPTNSAEHLDSPVVFSWNCSDPDGDSLTYSFFFGTNGADMAEIATGLTIPGFSYDKVSANTTYYWKVVAYDTEGANTSSQIWRFKTGDMQNHAPDEPSNPTPANHQMDVDESSIVFSWSGGDIDGDAVSYSIYLATLDEGINALKQIGTSQKTSFNYIALAKETTYYWQVKAADTYGKETAGPIWQFTTTTTGNRMPSAASPREPEDKATMVSVNQKLIWNASDPDMDVLYYDVYFGKEENPPLVSSRQTNYIYNPGELEEKTTYYWRIVVSDGKLTNPESNVWSFTTLESGVGDAPTVIQVTPPSNSDGVFKIDFSTAMNKNSMNTEIKFSPSIPGEWTWNDTGNSASFKPTLGWIKGSYNKFTLAAGSIADKAGIRIVQGVERVFTIPSEVTVPSGYRSIGFPYELAANQTYQIKLPAEIPEEKFLYMMTLARGDETTFVVTPRASVSGENLTDPTYKLRMLEKELIHKKLPDIVLYGRGSSSIRAAESDPAINSIRKFYISEIATTTSYPNNQLEAKLIKKSDNTLVYIDKSIVDAGVDSYASSVINKFDSLIYGKVRSTFGDEPVSGPDGNARTKIVIIPGKEGSNLLGFFHSGDLYPNDPSHGYQESNEGKIFYVIYKPENIENTYYVLAHEFQHMINYYQKNKSLLVTEHINAEDLWLNEGLSQYAADVCGFDIVTAKNLVLINQVKASLDAQQKISLTTWDDTDSSSTYGIVYLFLKYLTEANRYGNDNVYIAQNLANGGGRGLTGEANVENVTNEPFKETMAKFGLSLFLNRYNSTNSKDYGFKNLDLKGTYEGHIFQGFEIEKVTTEEIQINRQNKNALRCFKIASDGKGNKTLKIVNGNQPITLWFFDERP